MKAGEEKRAGGGSICRYSHVLLQGAYGFGIGTQGRLRYEDVGDGKTVRLIDPFVVQSRGWLISTPARMKFNFASIPWIFRRVLPRFGPWNPAAAPHDFLWEHALALGISRNEADLIFLDICWRLKLRVRGPILWAGLFLGGWPKWYFYRWRESGRFLWWWVK